MIPTVKCYHPEKNTCLYTIKNLETLMPFENVYMPDMFVISAEKNCI